MRNASPHCGRCPYGRGCCWRELLGNILTASQLARTESHWHQFGSSGDRIDRIAVVTADPTAWHALLVAPKGRVFDGDRKPPPNNWWHLSATTEFVVPEPDRATLTMTNRA